MRFMDTPSISVVMTTYNGEKYLTEQLKSVLAELAPDDELIIIDDGSSDGTPELLEGLKLPFVRVVRNVDNVGVLAAFECALMLSSKAIIFLCDQDDIWLPGKRLALTSAFQNNSRVLVAISDAQLIDASGAVFAPSFMATRKGFRGDFIHTLIRNRYLGCAMALRRELLVAALPIPRSVPMHDMWLGILGSIFGEVHYISTPLIQYRRHGGNVSPSHHQGWFRMLRWRLALLSAIAIRCGQIVFRSHLSPANSTSNTNL